MMKLLSIAVLAFLISCTKIDSQAERKKQEDILQEKLIDKLALDVINKKQFKCRGNSQYNCIKPINFPESGVYALEIKVNSTESFNIITYNKFGEPVDLNDNYAIEVKAIRSPARIDANIVKRTDFSN